MRAYYCITCKKHIQHNNEEEDFLYYCPSCNSEKGLHRLSEEDTSILKGKTIKAVYENEWKDITRLVLFEDGTHGRIDVPYSDVIEFHLLEHEYGEEADDE